MKASRPEWYQHKPLKNQLRSPREFRWIQSHLKVGESVMRCGRCKATLQASFLSLSFFSAASFLKNMALGLWESGSCTNTGHIHTTNHLDWGWPKKMFKTSCLPLFATCFTFDSDCTPGEEKTHPWTHELPVFFFVTLYAFLKKCLICFLLLLLHGQVLSRLLLGHVNTVIFAWRVWLVFVSRVVS